MKIYTA